MSSTELPLDRSSSAVPVASWRELLGGEYRWRALALTGGVALHAINVHIVTTILPSVVQEFGDLDYYAWNITLFVAASIFGATLTSKLLDVLGARHTYLLALLIFSLGSSLCALAPGMFWLLGGRSVQGMGGGLLTSLSYALIQQIFVQRLWPRAVALVSGMWGLATLLGPAVGGLFAQGGSWRWAFWSLLPVAAWQALLVMRQLPARPVALAAKHGVPWLKIILLTLSVLVVAFSGQVSNDAAKLLCVGAGIALGVLVAWLDQRPGIALLPQGAYQLRSVPGRWYACIALLMIASMTEIYVPYFLQSLHGYAPLQAGYLTAAMAGGWSLASLFGAGCTGRSAKRLLRAGPVLMALSLVALAWCLPTTVAMPWMGLWLALALAGIGLGVGLGWPHLLTQVLQSAPRGQESLASAGITTVQLYAMAMGAALVGLCANSTGLHMPGGLDDVRMAARSLFGWFALAPLLVTLLVVRLPAWSRGVPQ